MDKATVAICSGSGYVAGELLRLLLGHPHVEVRQVTSSSQAGRPVHDAHPNLRGLTTLSFSKDGAVEPCDVVYLAFAHGRAAHEIEHHAEAASYVVDCSADFRLRDQAEYRRWYGEEHAAPEWLDRFVYGLPERYRSDIRDARYVSGVGCNASATILALAPLADAGLLERAVADVKVGSSEAGARPSESSHHPARSGVVRSYMPAGHRHQAEIQQALGCEFDLGFSVTSVELVRGAMVTAHCFLHQEVSAKDLWRLYRERYGDEPFIRLVSRQSGLHRYPEPKLTTGTNYCDIGFVVDPHSRRNRVVVMAALDNLMKGAAGSAVQSMNLMLGFDERSGLTFPGLHPL
jgi:LysW-gamma-L-alpha-aminoadipyl-6-phosphate/LysW-L-glutamyl-5-phosphate reductase